MGKLVGHYGLIQCGKCHKDWHTPGWPSCKTCSASLTSEDLTALGFTVCTVCNKDWHSNKYPTCFKCKKKLPTTKPWARTAWKKRREEILEDSCRICKRDKTEVTLVLHHIRQIDDFSEYCALRLEDVVTICKGCHLNHHRGFSLCKRCHKKWHKFGYPSCKSCTGELSAEEAANLGYRLCETCKQAWVPAKFEQCFECKVKSEQDEENLL